MKKVVLSIAFVAALCGPVSAQVSISRASLAKTARFTVTSTVAPKGGTRQVQTFQVEVSGARGRADYKDAALGEVRYLVNDRGVYLFIPSNKAAQKMQGVAGIEGALKLAFDAAVQQLKGAKKIGSATVSGVKTDVYKNPKTGTVIHLGVDPGFRLPVKVEMSNEGGKRQVLVTGIQLNKVIPAERFALPAGTQVIESQGAPAGMPPGVK